MRHVGRSLPWLGDMPLVTGRSRFVADVLFPCQLHLRVVRSPVACGRLLAIDTAAARIVPGVVAVLTAADIAGLPPIGVRIGADDGLLHALQPVLATAMVRYAGEPLAAVVAESAGVADDAAELVSVEIAQLAPHVSTEGAAGQTSAFRSTCAATFDARFGDVVSAFAKAAAIVEVRLAVARDGPVCAEPRGTIATWCAATATLEIWTAARQSHAMRDALAAMLGLPRAAVIIHTCSRGGSRGIEDELVPEDVLVAIASRLTERPVRWIADRRDDLLAAPQGQGIKVVARAAVTADGVLLGLDANFTIDQGAYVGPDGAFAAELFAACLTGPYRSDAVRVGGHLALTNRPPAGAFASALRSEATFVRERLMDAIAARLGLEPMELRLRNFIGAGQAPVTVPTPSLGMAGAGGGRYQGLCDAAVRRFGLDVMRRRVEDRRARGEVAGLGSAFFMEAVAPAPVEHVVIAVDRSGNVEVVTGAPPDNRGAATVIAQIVADILGVDYDRIRITFGDTRRIPLAGGAVAVGSLVHVVAAAHYAAEDLREKILDAAGSVLGRSADRLTIQSGRIKEADRHFGSMLELGDVAAAVESGRLSGGRQLHGLSAEGRAGADATTFPYGVAIALVEIDAATGIVRVPRAFVAYEAGNAINPAVVESRLAGGVLDGVAGALFTKLELSDAGLPTISDLTDYPLPAAAEAPLVELLVLDEAASAQNALGLIGCGDGAAAGMSAAIAAAVDDALGQPGFVTSLPVMPEAVLSTITAKRFVPVG